MADKAELIIAALQERIGEIVKEYETKIALLRAELTNLVETNARLEEEKEYLKHLEKITE